MFQVVEKIKATRMALLARHLTLSKLGKLKYPKFDQDSDPLMVNLSRALPLKKDKY